MCDLCTAHSQQALTLEEYVKHRCMELGVNESITPYVLVELRKQWQAVEEGKALAARKGGAGASKKGTTIKKTQAQPRFASSQRGHRREAGKQLKTLMTSFASHLNGLVQKYNAGELSASRLQTRSSIAFKEAIDQAFKLGAKAVGYVTPTGAFQKPTKNETDWIKSYVKEELGYFQKFLQAVRNGQSERRNAYRIGRYAAALNSVYEAGRVLSVGPDVLIHWTLESDDPCEDCRLLARHNPYTIDTLPTTPKGGATRCLANCYCTLRIEKATSQKVSQVRKAHKSKEWLLRKIKEQQKRRKKQKSQP